MLTPKQHLYSQCTEQKVCISNSPASKMLVMMSGREEPAFCSLSEERSFICSSPSSQPSLQEQHVLWILTLRSTRLEVRKMALQFKLYLTRPVLNSYVVPREWEKTQQCVTAKTTLKSHLLLSSHRRDTQRSLITLYAVANLEKLSQDREFNLD